jgi:amino acid adenylation domain-containing protein
MTDAASTPPCASASLNALQRSIGLAALRAPELGLYIIQDICELEASIDSRRLKDAWQRVARRHGALRTRIETSVSGELVQTVEFDPRYEWSEEDWSGDSPSQLDHRLERFLDRDRARGFSWNDGPPMRFAFRRIPGDRAIVVWTVHHLLLDGRSLTTIWREWLAAYEGGEFPEVENPPLFAEVPDGAEQYWNEYLQGSGQAAGQITDRLRPVQSLSASQMLRERVNLSVEETANAHQFSRVHGFTVHTLIQGAWALLLSRYCGRSDVVFGVTRSGRGSRSEAVGMWIRTLPFRAGIDGRATSVEWLRELRRDWQAQRPFETVPLETVCRWGGLAAGAVPFDSLLVFDHASPIETLRTLDPRWMHCSLRRVQKTDAPLTLAAYGAPELSIELIYDLRFYCRETMRPLASHLIELLRSIVAQPNARIATLNLLTDEERRWLIVDVNRTAAPLPSDLRGQHLFERYAAEAPDATALEWHGGSMTYGELNRKANGVAKRLIEMGARPDDLIGVSMDRSVDVIRAMLGIFKAGAAFLALPPDLPEERISAMLEAAQPKFVIGNGWFRKYCIEEECGGNPCVAIEADHAAYAIFTSGSTGRPKAAILTHRGFVNYILAAAKQFDIRTSDRRLQFAHMGSDVFIAEVSCCLSCGATLVLNPPGAGRTLGEFLAVLEQRRITLASIPSSWASEWASSLEGDRKVPSALRTVVVGMERLHPAAFKTWKKIAKGRLRWFNAYGPSETSGVSTVYELGGSAWEDAGHVPIGAAISNTRTYVLDENRAPVPAGFVGELYIGGAGVGRGYLNASEKDASRFGDDPFHPGKMYRTGDLVYRLPDGNLVFVGRGDRQVKIRGFRIELEEIEAVLSAFSGVRHCAVVAAGSNDLHKNDPDKDDRRWLGAYIERAPDSSSGPADWTSHLRRSLPAHMVPVGFIVLDRMPMTPSGKVDRQSLPPFEPGLIRNRAPMVEPATRLERELVELWRESLGVARVSTADNFFELGGDSLAATRLIVAIENRLGRQLTLGLLQRAPTPARMALLLKGGAPAGSPFLEMKRTGTRPPFICVTTMAHEPHQLESLARRMPADQPFWVLPVTDPSPGQEGPPENGKVERLANLAYEVVRSAIPTGDCALGGYCLGGLVAYAVAQRLSASGAKVPLMVLFDTQTPGYPKVLRGGKSYFRQAGDWLRGHAKFSPRDVGTHLRTVFRLARENAGQSSPAVAGFPMIHFLAGADPCSTKVLEDPRLGWRDLCPAGVECFYVDAHHDDMFEEANIETIATPFTDALERAYSAMKQTP